MLKKLIAVIALSCGVAGASSAATTTSLLGDKDCFGTGGACLEDGSWVPTLWGGASSDLSDPAFTDRLISTSSTTSWTHTFAAGSYDAASLKFLTAGIADIFGPYDVFVDGTMVGSMPLDGFGHILAETFTFAVPVGLLVDGLAEVSFTSVSGDAWAIDYSELTLYSKDGPSPVPLPAGLPLLIGALGGLAFLRRKAK